MLLAHHAEAFLHVEIMGRSFPDGMTEHAVVFAAGAALLALVAYGAYAAARDLRRRLLSAPARTEAAPAA